MAQSDRTGRIPCRTSRGRAPPLAAVQTHSLLSDGNTNKIDTSTNGDCRRGGQGWVDYQDTDPQNGGRAVGVEACLDEGYLEANPGTKTNPAEVLPPGYRWAQRYAGFLGLAADKSINACHLLGKQLGGSGTDPRNLATCSRQANAAIRGDGRIDDNMASYEGRVRAAVDAGQIVHYKVSPAYSGWRTVPTAFEISAQGHYPDGGAGISFMQPVPNSIYSRGGSWSNLGLVIDSSTTAGG